ncbi:Predicted amidohydrolase [Halogranum amylolyticum]|uniref:Predicted amidohydrolase n=1 Tax=Halogranum amylolyticum TaxID=660520 RepID=A0A1H8SD46_9EURY|nr:carbon-nitrogen family hydrolase [Halogranum amylolyticum]SEO76650.1 Predicted amidohydrolase [Halogranum amylolyticum]
MILALAQLDQTAGDIDGNLERAERAVADAADRGADLVALPELFTVGYFAFESYARDAEGLNGSTFVRLGEMAAEHGVGLLAGSHVEDLEVSAEAGYDVPDDSGLANTAVFFDRDGDQRAVYRKHHLFGYESAESRLLTPGNVLETVSFEGFEVGMTTCYDLRFPELYRSLAEAGATLVLVPSAWPYPRVEHWQTLPRARAIENQCYVASVNGATEFDEARLLGRSTVFDPWGTPIASAGDEPTLVTAEIDPERVETVREEFPALADRR